ncbi:MAG TPA: phage protein Gp36 family protein [Candidatus Binatia bacterium]|nr:phage protein Gp36 family protein [Candidatus Binatia bacterium]
MAWSLITEVAVLDELNNAELEKYREIVADDQPDPLPGIISRVTDLVRAYVGKQTPLSAAGLPPEVMDPALDIIIYRLAKRVIPGGEAQRKGAADDAYRFLEGVAKGDKVVSAADGTIAGPVSPSVDEPTRTYRPEDQDGI